MTTEWCQKENLPIHKVDPEFRDSIFTKDPIQGTAKPPQRVRCPKCKKRFMTFTRECDDLNCYHTYFPKHKMPVKKKKKTSRDI